MGKTLTLTLKYGANRQRAIQGLRRISKPGLRVYAKSTNLPKVLGGLGVAILSGGPPGHDHDRPDRRHADPSA